MTKKIPNWWDNSDCKWPDLSVDTISSYWPSNALARQAIELGLTLYSKNWSGPSKNKYTPEFLREVLEFFENITGVEPSHVTLGEEHKNSYLFCWNQGFVDLRLDNTIFVDCSSFDEHVVLDIQKYVLSLFGPQKSQGEAYVLTQTHAGLGLKSIGIAAVPFIPENYAPDVVEDFLHFAEDIENRDPCGRLVIVNGPPGSGKSYLIRSLMSKVKNAVFVMVPAHMVASFANPDLLGLLVNLKEKFKYSDNDRKVTMPIAFIVEDADNCLASRSADNVTAISNLLNFSDGILGAMLDIRLICTTNVALTGIDSAATRAGRLCRQVEVNALEKEQAEKVFKRLTGKDMVDCPSLITLAEVYAIAKGDKKVIVKPHKKAGFNV